MRLYLTPVTQCIVAIGLSLVFSFCKKDDANPADEWQNTFTPKLEKNTKRDTIFDDEFIIFNTDTIPSDRYIWTWGDGSKSDTTLTPRARHQFKRLGLNIFKLRVERGKTYGEKTDSIWVKPLLIPLCYFRIDSEDFLYVQDTSHFVANINSSDCQSTCSFEYFWDFGDNSTGTGYHTTHVYNKTGNYLLTVRITRCNGPEIILQKPIVVTGGSNPIAYKCSCKNLLNTLPPFMDTILTQNLPNTPIRVEGRILRRIDNGNHYAWDYNCNPSGCETYELDTFNNLDSIQYKVSIPHILRLSCSGRRL